jgi:hypothetical protein
MNRLFRLVARFVPLALLWCASLSSARIVIPRYVIFSDTRINLVGYRAGGSGDQADSLDYKAKLTLTVQDVMHNPIAGMPVVIDFSGCTADIRIAATQSFHAATASCAWPTVQSYTQPNGRVTFVIIGGASARSDHPPGCARVYVDSYDFGTLNVGAYDQNSTGGMTIADIGWFWSDLGSGTFHDRSDLDGDGYLSLADLAWAWNALGHPFDSSGQQLCP